jgi:predicted Zn-dependent protease
MSNRPASPRRRNALGAAIGVAALALATLAPQSPVIAQDSDDAPTAGLLSDTEIDETIRQDADPIFAAADLNPKSVRVFVIGDLSKENMNSFVTGGQNMFVSAGLIIQTKSPNELIGVFAHETGHMAGGHLIRSTEGDKQVLATYLLTLGLGIAAAFAGAPDAAGGLLYSAPEFAYLTGAGFTRTQEASADQAAVTYLERSGQSAQGLIDFFDNFRYEEVFSEAKRYRYFDDHPLTDDRIDALQTRAVQQPHYKVVDTPEAVERHQIMIAKLRAYLEQPDEVLLDYPETNTSFPARYARAIAYSRNFEVDKAALLLDALSAERPNDPYIYQVKGQMYFDVGRPADAEAPLRQALALKPNAPELLILLGQTLLAEANTKADDPKVDEAVVHLHKGLAVDPDGQFAPFGWLYLSQAYDKKGEDGLARLAAAEENFALGQVGDAKMFAMRARMQLPQGSPEWRRATDIVLVSKPTKEDLRLLAQQGGVGGPETR